jgi:hypothetical protein
MKKSIIVSLALVLISSLSSLAVVQEYSPTKVLVDVDKKATKASLEEEFQLTLKNIYYQNC